MQNRYYIIYLVGGPLTNRWLQYYCLDELHPHVHVEYWDMSAIIEHPYQANNALTRSYCITIQSIDDLQNQLKRIPTDSLVVQEIGYNGNNGNILEMVSMYVKNMVDIDIWTYNLPYALKMLKDMSFGARVRENLRHVKRCFLRRPSVSLHHDKAYEKFVHYELSYKPQCKYRINLPDYEKYLQVRNDHSIERGRYIVYVGIFFPYHPELKITDPSFDEQKAAVDFFASMNRFFDAIESIYNCKVVIAEHPSANWSTNPYNGREIVYYKTAELIRDSIAVCMHHTNSFSFVAAFDKPLAILTNRALQSSFYGRMTANLATALGETTFNTDTDIVAKSLFKQINPTIRKKYLKIFAPKKTKLNSELYLQYFEDIHKQIQQ